MTWVRVQRCACAEIDDNGDEGQTDEEKLRQVKEQRDRHNEALTGTDSHGPITDICPCLEVAHYRLLACRQP